MEPADSIGHVDEAGFADAYDDEGDSFLPPQRDLDRMKLGKRLDVVFLALLARTRRFVANPGVFRILALQSMAVCITEVLLFHNMPQVQAS
jgi:hypothetical protein